jgi:hypothetical protein
VTAPARAAVESTVEVVGADLDPLDPLDPLALLERDDKWFLGGAPALLYAPPTPAWDHVPGMWDEAHFLHFVLQPVFTVTLVDETGAAVPLRAGGRSWRPDARVKHFGAPGLELVERQTCGPEDVLSDVVTVRNLGEAPRRLRLVAWTAQSVPDGTLINAERYDGTLVVTRVVGGLRGTQRPLALALDVEGARSWSLDLSEPCALQPHWFLSPAAETLRTEGLPNRASLTGVSLDGLVFAALELPIELEPGEAASVKVRAAVAPDATEAVATLRALRGTDPLARSERAWRDHFAAVPAFRCADAHVEVAYYYRWYGLRLNTLTRRLGRYRHDAVAEGPGYFRVPISYSAQCHMLETRWLRDPSLARGSFLTFADNQRADGSLPNHVHVDMIAPQGIYHADWGTRVLDVHRVHPDPEFLARAYETLERYLGYFYRERDPQGSGLYDHVNQWESGQEYMSRYVWVDDEGDHWKEMQRKLKGLDASVYVYRCERALAEIERLLDRGDGSAWTARADRTAAAIHRHMWRDDLQAFVDVSPELEPSDLLFAISFYPFFTDLVGPEHLPSIRRHLLDPEKFWTAFPVPASPKDDPYFSATPTWRGKRTNCPWNGRTWPMTNSHVAEALVGASALDPTLRPVAAEFIRRFLRMLCDGGDPRRPTAFEHYNPETGAPSRYRGFDDYMHSWIVDLIVKYVAGVQPLAEGVRIDPFPFDTPFSLRGVHVRGRAIDVTWDGSTFEVRADGAVAHRGTRIEAVMLTEPAEAAHGGSSR